MDGIINNKRIFLMPFSAKSVIAYHSLKRRQCNIAGFLDNAERLDGKSYCGTPICTPRPSEYSESLIILCESRFSAEQKIQLEELCYSSFAGFEDIVVFHDAQQAIGDVDVAAFAELAPAQFKPMKEFGSKYAAEQPVCLLSNEDFAISVAPLVAHTDVCHTQCQFPQSGWSSDELIKYLEKKNNESSIVAFLSKYPFGSMVGDGFHKAIIAADELFRDNCVRIYFEPNVIGCLHKGVEVRKASDDLIRVCYSKSNEHHISEVRKILEYCGLIYIHCIYYIEERILNGIGKPTILEIHSVVPEEYEYNGATRMVEPLLKNEAFAFNTCDKFLCRNESMAEYYKLKYGVPMEKMVKFPAFSEFSLPITEHLLQPAGSDGQMCVIFSGGTNKWHMIPMILDVISQHPEYKYIIATAEMDDFKKLTEPLGERDIEILYVKPELLEPVYRRARYGFALFDNAVSIRYACPTKLIEYCTFGVVPIMLSNEVGDFDKYDLQFVHYNDFLAGKLPDDNRRMTMTEHNYQIARKMAGEYEECKRELQKLISNFTGGNAV